ncbi:copper chaperone of lysine biosynthesis protein [Puccinia graminis f. sp. tritici]|uniref:holo-[acyl-carrier-protein] synthase n=1 Tax=Puccinia graminis f. sp. tritici TaxID=56615 RepID=A0A5B0MK63_PUCGR|nr:copper chaperone of lysine biosynthesis protein [Puccinia graminis f. sp. tritici]
MELGSISLSNLISHPEVNWDPIGTGSPATMRQEDFILPDRSSQLVVSINGQEDRSWMVWNEYKLPRSKKTVDEFGLLLEEHLSPREKELIDQRRKTDFNNPGNLLDGLLQIWTFKELIIKALGTGLSMELGSISLSNLISHPEVNWDPMETGSPATMRQEDFILPNRSSQLVVSINGQEDRSWMVWNAVWARPDSIGVECKYILLAALKSSYETSLLHPVVFKTISHLVPSP